MKLSHQNSGINPFITSAVLLKILLFSPSHCSYIETILLPRMDKNLYRLQHKSQLSTFVPTEQLHMHP